MIPAYLVLEIRPGDEATARLIEDRDLEDTISEDDANRFRTYAVAGDFYDRISVVVVKLGRRFTDDDHKP